MSKYTQGLFKPKNPTKYMGDVNKIRYMSSWELHFFGFLDGNPNVLKWASEEIAIPYLKPTDQRVHRYFPDLLVCYKNKQGEVKWELIEIKPKSQTKMPRSKKKVNMYEQLTYAINMAKWGAAMSWCKQKKAEGLDIEFKVMTEDSIFA